MLRQTVLESQKIVLSPLSLHDLKCRMMDSLHAIDDPKTRLSILHSIFMRNALNNGDDEEDFAAFYLDSAGQMQAFIEEFDRTPASESRDQLLLDSINFMFESAWICFCMEDALERAAGLLDKIMNPAIKDHVRAACIEMDVLCSWMPVARRVANDQELEDLIEGVKDDYRELSTPGVHCRLIAKLAVMMAEDDNVKYGIALALRIDDPYLQFLTLIDIAWRIQHEAKNEVMVSLLEKAGKLLPFIPAEHHAKDSCREHISDLMKFHCKFGLYDEVWKLFDGISSANEKISILNDMLKVMNKKKMITEIHQAITRCKEHMQSLNLVDKSQWALALIEKINEYKLDMDFGAMIISLDEEIRSNTNDASQIESLINLASCCFHLNGITIALQIFEAADKGAQAIQDIALSYHLRTEILMTKHHLRLGASIISDLEELNDPCLWALAASCLDHGSVRSYFQADLGDKGMEDYKSFLQTIAHNIPSIKFPENRVILYNKVIDAIEQDQ